MGGEGEKEEQEEEGGRCVEDKMKVAGGEVKINTRLEERGWSRNGRREGRPERGVTLPPLYAVHVKTLLLQFLFQT